MPAIQPALLKRQIDSLLEHWETPKTFLKEYKEFLGFYTDRTRRPGRNSAAYTLVRAYQIPKQVSKQFERALQYRVHSHPTKGLMLADILWQDSSLECRELAMLILGWISPESSQEVWDRLKSWCQECGQNRIMDASFARGLIHLWRNSPDLTLEYLESLLTGSVPESRKWGLRVALALVKESDFKNIPLVFRLLTSFVQSTGSIPDTDLLAMITVLAKLVPKETAYFLQRNFINTGNPGIKILIRQSLDQFDLITQRDLRTFLHQLQEEFDE
jgi:hypothetical protein